MTTPLRHALVVASQCRTMGELAPLEPTAGSLVDLLLDPDAGSCRPALDGSGIIFGELDDEAIRTTVVAAAQYAGRHGATLVVAFLGHGFAQAGSLRMMTGRSRRTSLLSTIRLNDLLADVFDEPGINGVLALVDLCMAGAGLPPAADLTQGNRSGRTRIAMLMAASADQPAYGLRFSQALVELMRSGVDGAGPFLHVDQITKEVLDRVPGQDPSCATYNGNPYGAEPWLARNRLDPGFVPAVLDPPAAAGRARPLSPGALQHLTRLLVAVPPFSSFAGAQRVLARFPATLRDRIGAGAGPVLDVPELLRELEAARGQRPWLVLSDALRACGGAGPELARLQGELARLDLHRDARPERP
ncbi:hypothetical protein AB0K00_49160 [Dactylosporangium sp. NPDC049525]|uniref:vWA-MoxR associated conflict system protein n=1 Tax=Dactylosporangium sp. NPDC049525 TaxID=3154730 RepID=UPI0034491B79